MHSEVESLNVATAAAVCLFETVRVRSGSGTINTN
jgi:tRNA G18 (ribose-2'-O)-methylase SpoU